MAKSQFPKGWDGGWMLGKSFRLCVRTDVSQMEVVTTTSYPPSFHQLELNEGQTERKLEADL